MEPVRLTKYSHGGGCGCKIAPAVLETILKTSKQELPNPNLLVGNSSKDDAAVYDMGNGMGIISTTDFFMPIVDDAFSFGAIASANAISDVYAMGGTPLMAIAILGWPINVLSPEIAQQVLDGARDTCTKAGIPLAGGHSIDSTEPIFGLAVTGQVALSNLKQNNTAKEGDLLLLTKPIGVGILATAQKRELISPDHASQLIQQLSTLNKVGEDLGKIEGVSAMTDVTGFGLLGHLIEMAEGSGLSAELNYEKTPKLASAKIYMQQKIGPDATFRNWNGYSSKVSFEPGVSVMEAFTLLPDPQTNGGLLIAVHPDSLSEVQELLKQHHLADYCEPIGKLTAKGEKTVIVSP